MITKKRLSMRIEGGDEGGEVGEVMRSTSQGCTPEETADHYALGTNSNHLSARTKPALQHPQFFWASARYTFVGPGADRGQRSVPLISLFPFAFY